MNNIAIFWMVTALVLCGVPLTNVLGYESSAVMAGIFSLTILFQPRLQLPSVDIALKNIFKYWVLSLVPLGVLIGNGLRVQNCDWMVGFQFWFTLPMVSIVLMVTLRYAGHLLSLKHGRKFAFGFVTLEFLWFLWKLAWWPSIAGYSWTFGWFAGSIYDEALSIPSTLLIVRLYQVLTVLALAVLFAVRHHGLQSNLNRALLLIPLATALLLFYGSQLGARNSTQHVIDELGGRLETEHFVVYFSPSDLDHEDLERLRMDIEYRYWELSQFFEEDPVLWKGRPIEIFIYPNVSTQYRLMGSRSTLVARPWTHQMHIRWTFGSNALAHEMAHLFTAPFGAWPFRLAAIGGVIPNIGFVEGIAVAADWPVEPYSPDQVTAVLVQNGKLPDLSESLTPWGFWKQPAGKAYQGMGSFVAWLIREYGIEKFKALYQTFDFYEVYGFSSKELYRGWFEHVKGVEVEINHEEQILMMYSRKSIFNKVCARAVAEGRRNFQKSIELRYDDAVRQYYQQLIEWRPEDLSIKYLYFKYLLEIKEEVGHQVLEEEFANVELHSDLFFHVQTLMIRVLINQDVDSAQQRIDGFLQQALRPQWHRHFLVMNHLLQTTQNLAYFSTDWGPLDRLAWLSIQVSTPMNTYLQSLNWFALHQYDVLNQQPIDVPLETSLLTKYHEVLFQSAIRTRHLERLTELIGAGVVVKNTEDIERFRWLQELEDY